MTIRFNKLKHITGTYQKGAIMVDMDEVRATLDKMDERQLVEYHKKLSAYKKQAEAELSIAKGQIDHIERLLMSMMLDREQSSQVVSGTKISLSVSDVVAFDTERWPDLYSYVFDKAAALRQAGRNDLTEAFSFLPKKLLSRTVVGMQKETGELPPGASIQPLTKITITHAKG